MLRFRDISTLVTLESAGDSRKLSSQTASRSGSIYRIALTGGISGLLFGFGTAVINGALLSLRAHFALSEIQVEVAASSLLYGCLFGAMAAGSLSDRYRRRSILRVDRKSTRLNSSHANISYDV